VNRTKASIERGIVRLEETAGLTSCPTCAGWWDVIEMDWPGRRREGLSAEWHVWREHGGRCPVCGREPTVQTVRFGWPLDPERAYEYDPAWEPPRPKQLSATSKETR